MDINKEWVDCLKITNNSQDISMVEFLMAKEHPLKAMKLLQIFKSKIRNRKKPAFHVSKIKDK